MYGNKGGGAEINAVKPVKDKAQTLLGFAVKSGKLLYGAETIEGYGKKLYLIVVCPTLKENSLKLIKRAAQRYKIPVIVTPVPLEDILFKTNCKAVALKNKQMADAIQNNINGNYTFLQFAEE